MPTTELLGVEKINCDAVVIRGYASFCVQMVIILFTPGQQLVIKIKRWLFHVVLVVLILKKSRKCGLLHSQCVLDP